MNGSRSDMKFVIDYFFSSLRKFLTRNVVRPLQVLVSLFFLMLFGIWAVLFFMLLTMIWE